MAANRQLPLAKPGAQTEAPGGDCCDYRCVSGKSPALGAYKDLREIRSRAFDKKL